MLDNLAEKMARSSWVQMETDRRLRAAVGDRYYFVTLSKMSLWLVLAFVGWVVLMVGGSFVAPERTHGIWGIVVLAVVFGTIAYFGIYWWRIFGWRQREIRKLVQAGPNPWTSLTGTITVTPDGGHRWS